MEMGRPKNNDYPPYMTVDGDRGGFIVRNPVNGKKKRYAAAKEADARKAAERLGELVTQRSTRLLLEAGRPTVGGLVDRWKVERLPLMPWDDSTRDTAGFRLERIKREKGDELVESIDCIAIEKWISAIARRADPFNKWRQMWVLLWNFAVAQKWAQTNEAEKVERRSISRKIKSNQKVRQQLDVRGYQDIYAQAEPWLQLAMDTSLVSLQARKEVCSMQHSHFRNGFLFVIRDKTAADSAMAFIKIRLTPELESLRARALRIGLAPSRSQMALTCERAAQLAAEGLSVHEIAKRLESTAPKIHQLLWYQRRRRSAAQVAIVSPFLIHRRPERMQRRWTEGKDHWSQINGKYLSEAFAVARDKVPRFAELPERQRPTFHEIRGLGSRLYLALGVPKKAIKELMTHSNEKTTEIYLERGPQALTEDDYVTVTAPFTVRELLGAK
jgi:hypothetical protein